MGYIIMFAGAAALNIAGGAVLTASQILWINFLVDVPLALALGADVATPGLMKRKPRPSDEQIMDRGKTMLYAFIGLFIAIMPLLAATLMVRVVDTETAILARTMVLTTLSLVHVFVALSSRDETQSIFSREFLSSGKFFVRVGISLIMIVIVTELTFLQNRLETTALNFNQWILALLLASVVLWVIELVKWYRRRSLRENGK
jgi:Ca2+-transporting ATPase